MSKDCQTAFPRISKEFQGFPQISYSSQEAAFAWDVAVPLHPFGCNPLLLFPEIQANPLARKLRNTYQRIGHSGLGADIVCGAEE